MRGLILLAIALLALPAFAQSARPVIGYLGAETPEAFEWRVRAFRQGLAEANYVEGRNVQIEYRWANADNARLPQLADELVKKRVQVLVAAGSAAAALAAKKATPTIPIVFAVGIDPVEAGLVRTLSRPGGNATGVTSLNVQMAATRLHLLSELVPNAKTFALLINLTNPKHAAAIVDNVQVAAHAQRVQLQVVRTTGDEDLVVAFDNLARQQVGGIVVASDTYFVDHARELGKLALDKRIPAIHQAREFVDAGGLASYGPKLSEAHRLAGRYTGRILQGETPASLPVQRLSQVELFINQRTARALGITVPATLRQRADAVVE